MPFRKKCARISNVNHKWTNKELNFLRKEWERESPDLIAHELKLSPGTIKYQAAKLGLKKKKTIEKWGWRADQFLLNNYGTHTNQELVDKLNKMFPYVKRKFTKQGIIVEFPRLGIARTAEETTIMYKKIAAKGSYKNNGGKTAKEIGHIHLHPTYYNFRGERKAAYIIKVSEKRWKLYKHYIWEQHWGPIPKGWQVSCLNGDELNFAIEDLILTKKRASAELAATELTDNFVFAKIISHREDKEELKALYNQNPTTFTSLIEEYRSKIKLNRKIDEKKKNK